MDFLRCTPCRSRPVYLVLIAVVVIVGLGSRRLAPHLPVPLRKSPGDVLWALLVFLLCGFVLRRAPTAAVAALATVIALAVEFSKLLDLPWLTAARHTRMGGLVLGYGFHA